VHLSNFKSNEYHKLINNNLFEPIEKNPILNFHNTTHYISKNFHDYFTLECETMKKTHNVLNYTNIELIIPFIHTIDETHNIIELLEQHNLKHNKNNLHLIMIYKIPSNTLLTEEFLEYFDNFSINSNNLTQLTLNLNHNSNLITKNFDEHNATIKKLLSITIKTYNNKNKYVNICNQKPSNHINFTK